jgi:Fic family protein
MLRDKFANWERYIYEARDIDPLIRLAVMHYQF